MRKLTSEEKKLLEDYFRTNEILKTYREILTTLKSDNPASNLMEFEEFRLDMTEKERDDFILMQEENIRRMEKQKAEILQKIDTELIEECKNIGSNKREKEQ